MTKLPKLIGIAVLASTPAVAMGEEARFFDFAKVTEVTPIYQHFEHRIPQKSCWVERVSIDYEARHRNKSATSTLVGGIIGGAIGHAVGHGSSNKKVGAVVGSMLGASIGNDVGRQKRRNSHAAYENVERCEVEYTTEHEERLKGYDVTYRYKGEEYNTRMAEHPGKRIKLRVNISPVDRY